MWATIDHSGYIYTNGGPTVYTNNTYISTFNRVVFFFVSNFGCNKKNSTTNFTLLIIFRPYLENHINYWRVRFFYTFFLLLFGTLFLSLIRGQHITWLLNGCTCWAHKDQAWPGQSEQTMEIQTVVSLKRKIIL